MTRPATLVALLLLSGCMTDDPAPTAASGPDGPAASEADGPAASGLRVLALGDSYTIGEGVAPADRWPHRLADRLRASGLDVAAPQTVAVTGWTTDELAVGIDAADPRGPFDLVTLLVGVNDQYDGLSPSGYRPRLSAMLDRAVALAGGEAGRVVAVSIPDWGATPFGAADARGPGQIGREVDAFNAVARAEAERRGAAWVDVTAVSRRQGDRVVADGLHPDAAAYAAWTDRIEPAARAALGVPPLAAERPQGQTGGPAR